MSRRTKYIIQEVPAPEAAPASANLLVGFIAGVMFGALGGYVLGSQALAPRAATAAVAPVAAVSPAAPLTHAANEQELQSFRTILANDPKNARAAVELGNRLYDAGRFAEAVPYYQQPSRSTRKTSTSAPTLARRCGTAGVRTRRSRSLSDRLRSMPNTHRHCSTSALFGAVERTIPPARW